MQTNRSGVSCPSFLNRTIKLAQELAKADDVKVISVIEDGVEKSSKILGIRDRFGIKSLQYIWRYSRAVISYENAAVGSIRVALKALANAGLDLADQIKKFPEIREAVSEFPSLSICGRGTSDRVAISYNIPYVESFTHDSLRSPSESPNLHVLHSKSSKHDYTIAGFALDCHMRHMKPFFAMIKGIEAQARVKEWLRTFFDHPIQVDCLG